MYSTDAFYADLQALNKKRKEANAKQQVTEQGENVTDKDG